MKLLLCGLNGAGKSTLGRTLAQAMGYGFLDIEDLYFPKKDPQNPYADPRSREDVAALLLREMKNRENIVLASVKGDFGPEIEALFHAVVLLEAPKKLRLQRVRARSFHQFGERMLPGGDLYESEENFFRWAENRPENTVENWLQGLTCPVLRVDGTLPVEENAARIQGTLLG